MLPLAEFKWSVLYLFRDQKHRGRCVIALKEHRDELFRLSEEQRNGFFAEASAAAEAIADYSGADKINYAVYGDIVSHFHVHLVPKHRDGLQWGGPFTDSVPAVRLSEEEYRETAGELIARLRESTAGKTPEFRVTFPGL